VRNDLQYMVKFVKIVKIGLRLIQKNAIEMKVL
jgi:hypothetical protein